MLWRCRSLIVVSSLDRLHDLIIARLICKVALVALVTRPVKRLVHPPRSHNGADLRRGFVASFIGEQ